MSDERAGQTLRGAVVGYGFICERGHVPAYAGGEPGQPRFDIVAVADICAERRQLARAALPGARVYETYEALLEAERDLDFVDICTPPAFHAEIALAALGRGLHVLCEKPLTTTAAEARSMLGRAVEAKRVLYPSHNYKHAPVVKALRRTIESGAIGDVSLVTLNTFRTTHAKGVKEWNTDWRRQHRYSGGGIAMDHGSHTFYLAFDWLGAYPTSISATSWTAGAFDTEDNLTCAIRFPTGLASAHLSWTAGVRKVVYTIHGTRGAVRVEDDEIETTLMETSPDGKQVFHTTRESISSDWMDASHVKWFRSLFDDFAGAIARGDYAGKEAQVSLRCVELIETAYASARRGGIELPLGGPSTTVDRDKA